MDYFIKEFGAVGDGEHFDTNAIQKAIDRCHENGGGRVVLEQGIYLSRTIHLKSNVELHLCDGAKLQGSINPNDYTDFTALGFKHANAVEGNSKVLIYASQAETIIEAIDFENIYIETDGQEAIVQHYCHEIKINNLKYYGNSGDRDSKWARKNCP